jgi:hypothetical protein
MMTGTKSKVAMAYALTRLAFTVTWVVPRKSPQLLNLRDLLPQFQSCHCCLEVQKNERLH